MTTKYDKILQQNIARLEVLSLMYQNNEKCVQQRHIIENIKKAIPWSKKFDVWLKKEEGLELHKELVEILEYFIPLKYIVYHEILSHDNMLDVMRFMPMEKFRVFVTVLFSEPYRTHLMPVITDKIDFASIWYKFNPEKRQIMQDASVLSPIDVLNKLFPKIGFIDTSKSVTWDFVNMLISSFHAYATQRLRNWKTQ